MRERGRSRRRLNSGLHQNHQHRHRGSYELGKQISVRPGVEAGVQPFVFFHLLGFEIVQATCKTMSIAANPSTKRKIMRRTRANVQPSCVDLRMTRQAHKRRTAETPNVIIGLAKSHCQKSIRLASITGNHSELNRCQRSAKNC
jgi:hypothetical protein